MRADLSESSRSSLEINVGALLSLTTTWLDKRGRAEIRAFEFVLAFTVNHAYQKEAMMFSGN